jgi:hypothetical protein
MEEKAAKGVLNAKPLLWPENWKANKGDRVLVFGYPADLQQEPRYKSLPYQLNTRTSTLRLGWLAWLS